MVLVQCTAVSPEKGVTWRNGPRAVYGCLAGEGGYLEKWSSCSVRLSRRRRGLPGEMVLVQCTAVSPEKGVTWRNGPRAVYGCLAGEGGYLEGGNSYLEKLLSTPPVVFSLSLPGEGETQTRV